MDIPHSLLHQPCLAVGTRSILSVCDTCRNKVAKSSDSCSGNSHGIADNTPLPRQSGLCPLPFPHKWFRAEHGVWRGSIGDIHIRHLALHERGSALRICGAGSRRFAMAQHTDLQAQGKGIRLAYSTQLCWLHTVRTPLAHLRLVQATPVGGEKCGSAAILFPHYGKRPDVRPRHGATRKLSEPCHEPTRERRKISHQPS